MKGSELIEKTIKLDMPDMEAVRKECIEELHKEKEGKERANEKKPNRKIPKSIYAGLSVCAALWLCVINLPAKSGAESWFARLQTWLHLNHTRLEVGKMEKNSIRIPEDCEEVEFGGEKNLIKNYTSVEELEEDIGRHLDIWRRIKVFEEDGLLLRIVDEEYASINLYYNISEGEVMESLGHENDIQDLECCITIPLSKDFSINNIKLNDQVLKDAILDEGGYLVDYAQNDDYSLMESYYSAHLDTDVFVIGKKVMDMRKERVDAINYYYLYFVYQGLSYQINCHSNLRTVKSIVEELE